MSALHRLATRRTALVVSVAGLLGGSGLLAGCGSSAPQTPTAAAPHSTALVGPAVGPRGTQEGGTAHAAKSNPGASNPDIGNGGGATAGHPPASGRARPAGHRPGAPDAVSRTSKRPAKGRPSAVALRDNGGPASVATNPCKLVSTAQATKIIGGASASSAVAPLGPTCIYRFKGSKTEITLAVQSGSLISLSRHLARSQQVKIRGRQGYCGHLGQETMYLSLSGGRVLSVAAPCRLAQRFAATALPHLAA